MFLEQKFSSEDKCHKEPGSRRRKCELFLVWKMFLVRQGRGYELWTGGDCSKSDILTAISWDKNIWKPPFKLHKVLRKITSGKQMLLYIKSLLKSLWSKNLPAFVCEALKVFPYCGKCLKCLRLQPWQLNVIRACRQKWLFSNVLNMHCTKPDTAQNLGLCKYAIDWETLLCTHCINAQMYVILSFYARYLINSWREGALNCNWTDYSKKGCQFGGNRRRALFL